MRQPPKQMIASDAIKAWKLTAIILTIIPIAITVGSFVLVHFNIIPDWIPYIVIGLGIVELYASIFLIPKLRWRRWRYEVFDQEIYIQRGVLVMTRTLIPMIRVQHVDTKQGPILKKYGLASLTISTAATTHEIPALLEEEAAHLRDQISELARVDQDDV
ncbi:PH domain-containing protein [Bacillaceae bacterium W0354]